MSSKQERKEALKAYKEREEIGGLYRILNTETGWQSAIAATPNLEGQRNRLAFAKKTNACFDILVQDQWAQYGPDAFAFVEVERLVKKPEQTTAEFREELADLLKLWEKQA